jgi:secreted trypsin-like serine protease
MRVLLLLCLALPAFGQEIGSNVVGGSNSNIANYRHQLSLRVNNGHSCGASILSGTKATTAAHCIGGTTSTYSVLAGTSDRTVTNCATCQLRTLNAQTRHPSYTGSSNNGYPNDVGTIRWATSIATNANIAYATLAASNAGNYAGQNCVITGWGRTCGSCGLPNILQQGTMTVLTNADCANRWSSALINNGHICVLSNTVGACNGDSGGPLNCGGVVTGITSWVASGCLVQYPSVYTRVSFFRTWIDQN